ncbi:MAG: hypothetical protein ACPLXC_01655 [Candidatus Pacearchaeota archaeon]
MKAKLEKIRYRKAYEAKATQAVKEFNQERNKKLELEKLKFKLTPYLKNIIKAAWIHNEMLYVICLNKYIVALTKHFSQTYKLSEEKVRVGSVEDLIKEINEHNTRVLISIRDGKIIYDPHKLIISLKININKGLMTGTKEAILRKFLIIKDYIKEIENIKLQYLDNIYTSTVEAAQTALVLRGHAILIPRLMPEMLKQHLQGRGLEKTHVAYATEIIRTFKAFEHKEIQLPNGRKLDDLARKAELFREAVKKLR